MKGITCYVSWLLAKFIEDCFPRRLHEPAILISCTFGAEYNWRAETEACLYKQSYLISDDGGPCTYRLRFGRLFCCELKVSIR